MAQRIRQAGQTHSMELIFFPLIILILVGLVANAFQSSAIQTVPVLPSPFCTGTIEPGECYPTNITGCDNQSNVHNVCNFNANTTFSFLSQNSPFTLLLQGNFNGFINAVIHPTQANLASNQPFVFFPNSTQTDNLHPNDTGTTVFGICGNINGTTWQGPNGGNGGSNIKMQCNQVFTNSTQVPKLLGSLPYSKVFNNSPGHTYNCTSFNSATSGGSVGATKYVFYGCDTPSPIPSGSKYVIVALNSTTEISVASAGNNTQVYAWILLGFPSAVFHSTDDPNYCAEVVGFGGSFLSTSINPSPFCTQWGSALHSTIGTANQGLFGTFLVLGFIAGIVFLVLALGVTLNVQIFTNGLGLGSNDQGTKLMQALGIGLLIWTFIDSEFGGWLTFLPFNLGIVGLLTLTTIFFLGLYWRLFSLE